MRTKFSKLLVAAITATLIVTTATDTMANIRIRFAKGKTTASVKGRVLTGGRVCYFVPAKAGQTLTASLSPSSSNSLMMIFESGERDYTYVTDVAGQISVCVDNLGRTGNFTLTVSLE